MFVIVAVLASLTPGASARWLRGISDITTYGDDIAICADEITLGYELIHLTDSFEPLYPGFSPVVGEPYPGNANPSVPLYGSASDALSNSNVVVSVTIPIAYTGMGSNSYDFAGQATVPTPSGFGDGDVLYAAGFDSALTPIAIPLTIGDPTYNCPTAGPVEIAFDVFTLWDLVLVDSHAPTVVLWAGAGVDGHSITVGVDGGPGTDVTYVGSFLGLGVGLVDLDDAGLGCDSSSLTLSGEKSDGTPVTGETNINPVGLSCLW